MTYPRPAKKLSFADDSTEGSSVNPYTEPAEALRDDGYSNQVVTPGDYNFLWGQTAKWLRHMLDEPLVAEDLLSGSFYFSDGGYAVPGSGLDASWSLRGVWVVNGTKIVIDSVQAAELGVSPRTFLNDRDTYVAALNNNGTITLQFNDVAVGAGAPSPSGGHVNLFRVRAQSGNITARTQVLSSTANLKSGLRVGDGTGATDVVLNAGASALARLLFQHGGSDTWSLEASGATLRDIALGAAAGVNPEISTGKYRHRLRLGGKNPGFAVWIIVSAADSGAANQAISELMTLSEMGGTGANFSALTFCTHTQTSNYSISAARGSHNGSAFSVTDYPILGNNSFTHNVFSSTIFRYSHASAQIERLISFVIARTTGTA